MLTIKYETSFKKDYKRIIKRGYDPALFEAVVTLLANEKPLPPKYHDHPLSGNHIGHRECHITPDWLLMYKISKQELILYLTRTGTHSDLFD